MITLGELQEVRRSLRKPRSGSVEVEAPATEVFAAASDPVLMATLGQEVVSATWLDSEAGVGRRFRGNNRQGRRKWHTVCTVTDHTDSLFGYDVHTPTRPPILISHWQYEVEPIDDDRCRVTETNWIRVPAWFVPFAVTITGIMNRPDANNRHINLTLNALKEHVESHRGAGTS